MKPILIIKCGETLPGLKASQGDFDDWIVSGCGLPRSAFMVTPAYQNYALPSAHLLSAVIISGSHANVTDRQPWMERAARWLCNADELGLPMLGICFGHQLLAEAFGGKAGPNPNGLEIGLQPVYFNACIQDDDLLNGLPEQTQMFTSHAQTVLELAPNTTVLASNSMDKYHALRIGNHIWGLQFHPEFTPEITRAYIDHNAEQLHRQGRDPEQMKANCDQNHSGKNLLKQFVNIVENR